MQKLPMQTAGGHGYVAKFPFLRIQGVSGEVQKTRQLLPWVWDVTFLCF